MSGFETRETLEQKRKIIKEGPKRNKRTMTIVLIGFVALVLLILLQWLFSPESFGYVVTAAGM